MDYGADYIISSTRFVTLVDMKPSNPDTSYLIEIAKGLKPVRLFVSVTWNWKVYDLA